MGINSVGSGPFEEVSLDRKCKHCPNPVTGNKSTAPTDAVGGLEKA